MFDKLKGLVASLENLSDDQLRTHKNCIRPRKLLQEIKVEALRLRKHINDKRVELNKKVQE